VGGEGHRSVSPARPLLRDLKAPPNLVTLARLLLVPPALALAWSGARAQAAIVVAISLAGDGLDGWLARRTGRVTELGKVLDPLADKVTVDSVLGLLAARGEFPLWALGAVLARDVAIVAGASALARRDASVPRAAWPGKAALAVLGAMAVTFLLDLTPLELPLLAAGMLVALLSGAWYAVSSWRSGAAGGGAAFRRRERAA